MFRCVFTRTKRFARCTTVLVRVDTTAQYWESNRAMSIYTQIPEHNPYEDREMHEHILVFFLRQPMQARGNESNLLKAIKIRDNLYYTTPNVTTTGILLQRYIHTISPVLIHFDTCERTSLPLVSVVVSL